MEVEKKTILHRFIEGQTQKGPKLSSALNEPHEIAFCSSFQNQALPPRMHHHKWNEIIVYY